MHSNDNHLRVNDPKQQYERFYFSINEPQRDSHLDLAWVVVWRGEDKVAPSVPANLKLAGKALSWDASTDNVAVRGYEVRRKDGEEWTLVTFCTCTQCDLDGLAAGTYTIRSVDVSDNRSTDSAPMKYEP